MEIGKVAPQFRYPFDCGSFWPSFPSDEEVHKFLDGLNYRKDNLAYSFTKSVKSSDGKTTVEIKSTNSITCEELLRAIEDVLHPPTKETANKPMKTKKKKKVCY